METVKKPVKKSSNLEVLLYSVGVILLGVCLLIICAIVMFLIIFAYQSGGISLFVAIALTVLFFLVVGGLLTFLYRSTK